MPVKHLLTRGLGFLPGSIKFMITHGLSIGEIWTAEGDQATPWSPKTSAATGIWTNKTNDASSTWTTI